MVVSILLDHSNTLWIGTTKGLHRFDQEERVGQRQRAIQSDIPQELTDGIVKTLFEDSEGRLWIGDYEKGLAKLDREKGNLKWFYNPNPIHSI